MEETEESLEGKRLASLIVEELKKEFSTYYFTRNLVNTINVYREEGKWIVDIPAELYSIKKFHKSGAIVYTGKGSYANRLIYTGGFNKQKAHKNYVNRCIERAIQRWMLEKDIQGRVSSSGR